MQRRPVTDAERGEVRRRHTAGETRNQIARALNRSASTVSRIAREEGLRFEGGARVAPATAARQLDLAEQRRELVARLYRRAAANLDRVEAAGGYVRVELLPDGRTRRITTDDPPAQDERHHSQAIGSYLSSAARLAEIDANNGAGEVRSMLTDLARGIRGAFADEGEGDTGGG